MAAFLCAGVTNSAVSKDLADFQVGDMTCIDVLGPVTLTRTPLLTVRNFVYGRAVGYELPRVASIEVMY